ncbi:hypothetical protein HAZT_HAZT011918 [Hyalella azteca]|uniref:RING finger protein 141 n=1 Tax=Hyalella azteca TaxID=294128 RepID=A0A6A0HH43_HYAAZ|nr:hypothetical protein HAZT_HAZT011918 [Hyalella azteca]
MGQTTSNNQGANRLHPSGQPNSRTNQASLTSNRNDASGVTSAQTSDVMTSDAGDISLGLGRSSDGNACVEQATAAVADDEPGIAQAGATNLSPPAPGAQVTDKISRSCAADLAGSAGLHMRDHLRSLHDQFMQQAGADYDIATATTLSYSQFLFYITKLNEICRRYEDGDGRVLVFAVKKGSDSSVFWKATVRIACVRYNTRTRCPESSRMLSIRQFLQARVPTYQLRVLQFHQSPLLSQWQLVQLSPHISPTGATDHNQATAAALATAAFSEALPAAGACAAAAAHVSCGAGGSSSSDDLDKELDECIICLERRPDVILPCAHAYCLPCIQQWWEYCKEGVGAPWYCSLLPTALGLSVLSPVVPLCREAVADADDTWVISEAPDEAQRTREIGAALMGLAEETSGDVK